jgi:preprotein translocase subunit SecY
MIGKILNIFRIPELRKKILFTIGAIVVFRLGAMTPIPGTSWNYLQSIMEQSGSSDAAGGYLGFISAITGGSMQPFLFCLGIMPYISASIVLQLLTTVVPALEKLAKEGEAGRKKINEYTRYLAVALCLVQGTMIIVANQGKWPDPSVSTPFYILTAMAGITAGTIFLMWLGEQIDEFGIGNGISLIIMAGIVDRIPTVVLFLWNTASWDLSDTSGGISAGVVLLIFAMFVAIVVAVVLVTQGQRRIPIQQAKMVRGRRVFGSSQRQYLPLRVNQAGVIPVIFASSLLIIPGWIMKSIAGNWSNAFTLEAVAALQYGHTIYLLVYVSLVFVFCYFWTALTFQPNEMANNLRDYGSFVPGMRPGRRTADYLEKVMNRITYVGAAFLAAIAVTPVLVSKATGVDMIVTGFLGGTGLLIIVSVALDVVQRIESHLIMRHYEGFLSTGRVKGRRG